MNILIFKMSKRKEKLKDRNAKLPVNRKLSVVGDKCLVGFVLMEHDVILKPAIVYLTERGAEEFAFFQKMEKHRNISIVRCTYCRSGSDYVIFGPKSKIYSGSVQFVS